MLQACDDVPVGYINRGNIVRANYLHHSRGWIWRAGNEDGHMAIVKCVGEEPDLPTILHAHEDGPKILVLLYPCQPVCLLANGNVGWKPIKNAVFEIRYRIAFDRR